MIQALNVLFTAVFTYGSVSVMSTNSSSAASLMSLCLQLAARFDGPSIAPSTTTSTAPTRVPSMSLFCARCLAEAFSTSTCSLSKCLTPYGTFDASLGLCSCSGRWWGPRCDYEHAKCVHGTFNKHIKQCACEPGWTGTTCNSYVCNHGLYNTDTGVCECPSTWNGTYCDEIICHATQGEVDTDGSCKCIFGYKGQFCETKAIVLPTSFWEISGGLVIVGVLWTGLALTALVCEYRCTNGISAYQKVTVNGNYV